MKNKKLSKKEIQARYRKKNKDKIKKYQELNKDAIKEYKKDYYIEHKSLIREKQALYRASNKEKLKVINRNYKSKKRKSDPSFRIKEIFSKEISRALAKRFECKNTHSINKFLPYSFNDLKIHLESLFESWMSWDNYGKYSAKTWNDNDCSTWTWNIDHIIPHSIFEYSSMEDEKFRKCWELQNLRPYSAKQNFLDGILRKRHIKKDFIK